ncbi:MAG: T9SS type A sorting domain-containing protein, partial [Bacteroidales bacterium]|nr:T9SS type A sorting domain-containing protein [Bacteroidales bacterium]
TDGPLTLATDGMAQAVFVYTLSGNPVGGWRMNALTETSLSLDVSALAPGVYLLSVTTPNATTTAKFIRR